MKKNKLLLSFIIMMFLSLRNVNAITYTSTGVCYYFNHTTGAYTTNGSGDVGKDCIKKIGDKYAYCTQLRVSISSNTGYSKDSNWKKDSKKAIIAGMIIEEVNKKYTGTKAYAMTAAVINTYFNKALNSGSSRNFYATNKTIKTIYDDVMNKYKKIVLSKSISKPSLKLTDSVLNYISGSTYISDKITLSGLKEYVGESSDKVSYTLSASSTKGTVSFCKYSNGTGCTATVSFSGRKDDYPFYLKVDGADTNSIIKVNVKGTNVSKYQTSTRYIKKGSQNLIVGEDFDIKRSTSQSIQLTIPSITNHRIIVSFRLSYCR